MSKSWQTLQTSVLILVFLTTLSVLIKGLIQPSDSSSVTETISLPEKIEIENWQLVDRVLLETENQTKAWQYQYTRNDRGRRSAASPGIEFRGTADTSLVIESYFIPSSEGNVSRFLQVYKEIPPATAKIEINQEDSIGFYGLFIYESNPYLAACINPYGQTTVTSQQFAQNVSQYGLKIQRIFPWLLGRQDLIDRSCLLTVITIETENIVNESSLTIERLPSLEQAWFSWYEAIQNVDENN